MNLAVAFGADMGAVDMGDDAVIGETVRRRGPADCRVEAGRLLVDQVVQPLDTDRTALGALDGRGRPVPDAGRGECAVGERGRSIAGDRGIGDNAGLGGVVIGQYPVGTTGTVAVDPGDGAIGDARGRVDQAAASEAPCSRQA